MASMAPRFLRPCSFCIHVRNLQKLMIEIYKSMNHLNPSLIWEFPEKKQVNYNLRTKNLRKLPKINRESFGQMSLSFWGEGVSSGTPWMTISKMSQWCWFSNTGTNIGLGKGAPAESATN